MVSEISKEKVNWTKTMNLHLAKFMEDKPNIWDPDHPKMTNNGLRDETFAEFAAQYDDLSWQAVKDRWTNIRSTYGFYMRKVKAQKNKGKDFKVGWFMWKPCKYLYNAHRTAKSKRKTTEESNNQDAVEDLPAASNDASNDDVFSESSDNDKDNVTCDSIVNNIATVFKGVQRDTFNIDRSQYAAVGNAVTKKLSQLNSYDAAQLSQKILEILAEYDENNPMNPNTM